MKAKRLRRTHEKFASVVAPQEAENPSLWANLKRCMTRPLLILFDPICLLISIYLSIVYAVLYMMFSIYPIIFIEDPGWSAGVGELPLIGLAVGAAIAAASLVLMARYMSKKAGEDEVWGPERRLPLTTVGAVILPLSMFWLAWSGNYDGVPWIVPTIAGALFAAGVTFLFASFSAYLADSYLSFAASALAAATVTRWAAAAAAPLFTSQMFHALKVGGAGSLPAGVAVSKYARSEQEADAGWKVWAELKSILKSVQPNITNPFK